MHNLMHQSRRRSSSQWGETKWGSEIGFQAFNDHWQYIAAGNHQNLYAHPCPSVLFLQHVKLLLRSWATDKKRWRTAGEKRDRRRWSAGCWCTLPGVGRDHSIPASHTSTDSEETKKTAPAKGFHSCPPYPLYPHGRLPNLKLSPRRRRSSIGDRHAWTLNTKSPSPRKSNASRDRNQKPSSIRGRWELPQREEESSHKERK